MDYRTRVSLALLATKGRAISKPILDAPPSPIRGGSCLLPPFVSALSSLHGQHGNRSAVDTFDWKTDAFAFVVASKDVQQRQVVVGRRN